MALINIGNDPWLSEYASCDKLQGEIMEMLSQRAKELKSSSQYVRLSASIRLRLKQYATEVEQLQFKLNQEGRNSSITYEEIERRSRQVEQLRSRNIVMTRMFEGGSTVQLQNRNQLLGVQDLGTADWGTDENLLAPEQNIDETRQQQAVVLIEQDQGLEELSKIISRQKNIAQTINDEVDLHNEILDDLGEHVQRTDVRVTDETQNVQLVARKDRTCGYWIVIILLFIAIIAVAV